jgi:hypothetical protein
MMKPLKPYMQQQETAHFWSMRWVIVASVLQAAAVFYLGLAAENRARVPEWLLDAWVVLAVLVAMLAAIAAAVHPQGGVLALPLGPAVMPGASRADAPPSSPAGRYRPGIPEDAPPAPSAAESHHTAPGAGSAAHPSTPTSPNEPSPPAPEPPPDPDTTPIPVPAPPPAPPDPAPPA